MEYRPWGGFEVLADYPGYKVKILTVNPGKRLSLQRHRWRTEVWVIVEGEAFIEEIARDYMGFYIEPYTYTLHNNDSTYIEKGWWHRVTNKQQTPLVILELQTGNCFEDDIERKEDDYGRVGIHS